MICCVASRRVKAVTVMSWVRSNTAGGVRIQDRRSAKFTQLPQESAVVFSTHIIIIIIFLYSAVSLLNQQRFTTVNDKEN